MHYYLKHSTSAKSLDIFATLMDGKETAWKELCFKERLMYHCLISQTVKFDLYGIPPLKSIVRSIF